MAFAVAVAAVIIAVTEADFVAVATPIVANFFILNTLLQMN